MQRYILISATLFATACSHGPTQSGDQKAQEHEKNTISETSNFFGTTKVHRFRLPNGLKVLMLEDHSAPTVAVQTWFKVGSRDEDTGLTGLAHLFEHMMFKETKNLKDGVFDKLLEQAGAEGENAFTSRDYTGYVQSLPSDKLELIVKLESDRMVNLLVNDNSLNKEREVVHNERRFRMENNPDGQLYERIYELAYTKHSYHWPVIGYKQNLENAKRIECENFYKRFYAPNNATLVIVGDISPDKTLKLVQQYYGFLPPSNIDRRTVAKEPPQTAERLEVKEIKTPVEKLMVAYHTVDVNSDDLPNLEILRNILAVGKSSRLYRRLVDGGIATEIEIENEEKSDPALFLLMVNMQKGKTAKQALAVIDEELKEVESGNISKEEISRAISMHRFTLFDSMTNNHAKAQFLGFYETVAGRFERGVEVVNAFKNVDRKSLVNVLKKHFRPQNRSIVIGKPSSR